MQPCFHHILSRDHLSSFSSTGIPSYDGLAKLQPSKFLPTNDMRSLKFQLVYCTAIGWKKFRWPTVRRHLKRQFYRRDSNGLGFRLLSWLGAIFILRKGVLRLFWTTHLLLRTFSLHKVRENSHFLDHPPTPMSLRNIKMAPYSKLFWKIGGHKY